MQKNEPVHRCCSGEAGLTLIETSLFLILLGVVASMGLPRLEGVAALWDRGDALAAVSEAQNRINVKFTALLIAGHDCERAARTVSDLALVSDETDFRGPVFKAYALSPGRLEEGGTVVSAVRVEDGRRFENLAVLQRPRCGADSASALGRDVREKLQSAEILEKLPAMDNGGSSWKNQAARWLTALKQQAARWFPQESEGKEL